VALKSFSPGSALGLDGLRPLHIQQMVQMSSSEGLPAALAGGVPLPVRHVLLGASLHALRKEDGGLRPIAVGLTLRRLASKIASCWAMKYTMPELAPRQLGVGYVVGQKRLCMLLLHLFPLLLHACSHQTRFGECN